MQDRPQVTDGQTLVSSALSQPSVGTMDRSCDVAVVGGGPTGFAAALGLAHAGLSVTVVAGRHVPVDDGRTAAVFEGPLAFLAGLGVGAAMAGIGSPLRAIRIVDVTGSTLRAPTVLFQANEIGHERFGMNLPTAPLTRVLHEAAAAAGIPVLPVLARTMTISGQRAQLALDDGAVLSAALVVAADGQNSTLRHSAGITTKEQRHAQTALTFQVEHTGEHEDVSTEFHTRGGPFTLVPNGKNRSSVVWMTSPAHAQRLMALDDEALAASAQHQARGLLGRFRLVGGRGSYPLRTLVAERFGAERLVLMGEAAHAFPPIGAQGLNLGLRDAILLTELCERALKAGQDPGGPELVARYAQLRRRDALLRAASVDGLNTSLTSGFAALDALRGFGLTMLRDVAPLRRLAMRLGMAEPMRPAAGQFDQGNRSWGMMPSEIR